MKTQVLVDFVAELTHLEEELVIKEEEPVIKEERKWILSVDGASNMKGSRVGIILEGPNGVLLKQSLEFTFKANNNHAEYEALLARMQLATNLGVKRLVIRSDSQLVIEQVAKTFRRRIHIWLNIW